MTHLLRRMGYRVVAARSCADARAVARKETCDFLISDIGLEDGSGLDLVRGFAGRFERRAIALTGYGMESDVRAAQAAGVM